MDKTLIGMVHVHRKESPDVSVKYALKDVKSLARGGIDKILFENWDWAQYTGIEASDAEHRIMADVIRHAKRITDLEFGINILPLDYPADFELARRFDAAFVQLDTFSDRVRTDYESKFIMDVKPSDILAHKSRLGLDSLELFVNIQTKHYTMMPVNKKIETSAKQALSCGADVLVVTGRLTGEKTPLEKLIKVRNTIGSAPMFVGSGLTTVNAVELLQVADGAIVGTSLKKNSEISNPVVVGRVKRLTARVKQVWS